jgi:outer membrane protein OmpA-like peptidoglycan-associated protein
MRGFEMKTRSTLSLPTALALAWAFVVAGSAHGSDAGVGRAPDTLSMIHALQPASTEGGTRNLVVRQKTEGAADAGAAPAEPRPNLSLAIHFEPNSARVRPESGALLGNLVAAMLSPELRSSRFVIEGHADARGGQALNQRLSQERAEEVRLYLVALGVSPERLKAVGKGAAEPANPLDPLADENRRVRVVTLE